MSVVAERIFQVFVLMVIASSSLSLCGCGGRPTWQTATYSSEGVVKINGLAPEGLTVILHPTGQPIDSRNSQPWGIVDADGKYQLTTYEHNDGCPAGHYAVTLFWPMEPGVPSILDKLNGSYITPDKAPMMVTIVKGMNTIPPIVLNGVKIKTKPTQVPRFPKQ